MITLSFSLACFSCSCSCYHLLVQAPDAPEVHEVGGQDGGPCGGEGEGPEPRSCSQPLDPMQFLYHITGLSFYLPYVCLCLNNVTVDFN